MAFRNKLEKRMFWGNRQISLRQKRGQRKWKVRKNIG